MKRFRKTILSIIILVLLLFASYKLFFGTKGNFRPINMVPENAFMIIETDDPFKTWRELEESSIWQHLKTNSFFNDLNSQLSSTDSMIRENKILFRLFGSRKIMVSLHHIAKDTYGSLIVADLKNLSKLKVIKNYLSSVDNQSYTVSSREFQNFNIYEIYDKQNREMIYMSFVQNLLIISYNHLLLEKSLSQCNLPILARDEKFIEISNQIETTGQIRFYLNFKEINKLVNINNDDNENDFNTILRQSYFAGWKLQIDNDLIDFTGHLNGFDSIPTLLNALDGTGKGGNSLFAFVPKRTFLMVHLSFGSFESFIENMEANLKSEGIYDDYAKNLKRLEQNLEISVDENILSWIGDEIGILNIKSKYKTIPTEYVLAIKSNKEKEAIKQLDYINAQIKKNVPVKFKSIEYKNIKINYLSAQGLFKIFFGKVFSKLQKPYYMIFNGIVYFSNHPQTLKDIIDDVNGYNTLGNWIEYENFVKDNFREASNIYVYLNTPVMVDEFRSSHLKEYSLEIKKNKSLFDQLPFIGIRLNFDNKMFNTHLAIQYRDSVINEVVTLIPNRPILEELVEFPMTLSMQEPPVLISEDEIPADPFDIEDFAVTELSKGVHIEYYEDGSIMLKAETNDGIINGDFTNFYQNGEVKISGKFKNDRKTGTWKYYDENGKLIEKRKFD